MYNVNLPNQSVTGNQYIQKETKEDLAKQTEKEFAPSKDLQTNVSEDDINKFQDAKASYNMYGVKTTGVRTIKVSKYVDAESEARITGFIKGYEANYNKAFDATANEFPDISDEAAGEIALAYMNALYK